MTSVGIIANPSSGKDIRRIVAQGWVVSNQEKVAITRRLLRGIEAAGVTEVLFM
ncbi:MAG TPA: ATP-NAD kinase, partial [Chloroflexia bacterium]|nr:ATP-NAD kinase [Chloroflexia bacterium]